MSSYEPDEHFVLLEGLRMYVDPQDRRAEALARANGVLHPDARALWRALLASSSWDYVVDVGANYGEMLVGMNLRQGVNVVAVEPNPRLQDPLRRTLAAHVPQSVIIPVAISETAGTGIFYEDLTWSGNSTLAEMWVSEKPSHQWQELNVSVCTLDEVLARVGVKDTSRVALKLDIEGLETAVLRSSIDYLRELEEVAIMVEVVRMSEGDLQWLNQEFHLLSASHGGELIDIVLGLETNNRSKAIRDVVAIPRR